MIIDEQKKKEALYEHLVVAYNQYKKGSSQQINTIVEQMAKPSKQPQQIAMWVEQFNRLILQLSKTQQDAKVLIDAILYQIPWFSSDNHMKSLQSFKKCVATILCIYPNLIQSVYALLVDKLNIDSSVGYDQLHKNDIQIELIGTKFINRSALVDEVQRILQSVEVYGEDEVHAIEEKSQKLMMEIFKNHPNALGKLVGISKVGVGYFPSKNPTKCFYVMKQDGLAEDISYIKSVDNLIERLFSERYLKSYSCHLDNFQGVTQMISELDRLNRLYQVQLMEQLSSSFPHKSKHEFFLKAYIMNLLILADAIPNLRPRIIKLIMLRLISIDSEIKSEAPIRLSPFIKQQRSFHDEMSKKLDHLMYVVFEYFENNLKIFESKQMLEVFMELQKLFQENILKNQQSSLVHFLFLVLCGQDQFLKVQQLFVTRLILNIRDESVSRKQRVNSVFYLNSLLQRCRGLRASLVQRTIELLVQAGEEWTERCLNKIEVFKSPNQPIDSTRRTLIQHECEVLLHVVQMFAALVGSGFTSNQVMAFLLTVNLKIGALAFINNDVIIRLNERLLKLPNSELVSRLIETTADLVSKQFEKGIDNSPSNSPNVVSTPMINDYESLYSRPSTWTTINKPRNQTPNDLEYQQPFNNIPLIVSERFVRKSYIQDHEIPSVMQGWNSAMETLEPQFRAPRVNGKRRTSNDMQDRIQKKVK